MVQTIIFKNRSYLKCYHRFTWIFEAFCFFATLKFFPTAMQRRINGINALFMRFQ